MSLLIETELSDLATKRAELIDNIAWSEANNRPVLAKVCRHTLRKVDAMIRTFEQFGAAECQG